ncbi:MAG: hypothetical protein L3J82_07325 [Planctomycetes bacterium]|nr:hypothetical protein [Planctomycetota bacterium]
MSFRLVVGQNVFSTEHKCAGQLLGFTQPSNVCTVRLNNKTSSVVNVPATDLRLASWDEISDGKLVGSEPSLPTV